MRGRGKEKRRREKGKEDRNEKESGVKEWKEGKGRKR